MFFFFFFLPTYIVTAYEKGSTETECKPCRSPHVAVLDQSRWHGGLVAPPPLDNNEQHSQDSTAYEQDDKARVTPFILDPAPLQSQETTDDTRKEECTAQEIQLRDLIHETEAILNRFRALEEEQDEKRRNQPNRQVDVEAPTPRDIVRQGTAHQGSGDTGNAKRGTDHTRVDGPFVQGHDLTHDENRPRQ